MKPQNYRQNCGLCRLVTYGESGSVVVWLGQPGLSACKQQGLNASRRFHPAEA